MLVISRREGERIVMDGGIVITAIEAKKGTVRIGIDAPPDVRVWREELLPVDGSEPRDPRPASLRGV